MCFQITWDLYMNRHVFSLQILTSARKKTFALFIPNVLTLLVLTLVNVFLDTSCTMVFVTVRCDLQLKLARRSSHKNFLNSLVPSTRELEMHESRRKLLKLAIETSVHLQNPLPKSNRLCKPDFNRVVATGWNWQVCPNLLTSCNKPVKLSTCSKPVAFFWSVERLCISVNQACIIFYLRCEWMPNKRWRMRQECYMYKPRWKLWVSL